MEKVITFRFAEEAPDAVLDQLIGAARTICEIHQCELPIIMNGEPPMAVLVPTVEETREIIRAEEMRNVYSNPD